MAAKPAVLPEVYNGDGNWDEWITHFKDVAEVNGWDDVAKLRWLKVRFIGRAQRAFQRLPDVKKADFQTAIKSMEDRFEPATKKELYAVEFQTYQKRGNEGWAELAENLKSLADKAYKELGDDAKKLLALNQYLKLLTDPQIAFAVRQQKPKNLDEAVTATLEIESFIKPHTKAITGTVNPQEDHEHETSRESVGAVGKSEDLTSMLKLLADKLDNLQLMPKNTTRKPYFDRRRPEERKSRRSNSPHSSIICWKCGREGHIARFCFPPHLEN